MVIDAKIISSARKALIEANKNIPHSSNKSPDAAPMSTANMVREATKSIRYFIYDECKTPTGELPKEFFNILNAMVAKATQHGNCGELSSFAFTHLLEEELNCHIEIINITIATDHGEDGHTFVVLNRDERSDLRTPETWKNVIIVDPWGREDILLFGDDIGPKMSELALIKGRITSVSLELTLSGERTQMEYEAIHQFLSTAKHVLETSTKVSVIFERIARYFERSDPTFASRVKKDLGRILDEKISFYHSKADMTPSYARNLCMR